MLFDDIPLRTVVLVELFAGSPTHSAPALAGLLLRRRYRTLRHDAWRVSYGSPREAVEKRPRTVAPTG
ncbi:hypothetical protein XH93_38370 [Bradyrhizobium sp. CCBAU 51753]|nr:hypothetical protein XH93_38370 [Bradyrhizobium sp. CCBAU 51753]